MVRVCRFVFVAILLLVAVSPGAANAQRGQSVVRVTSEPTGAAVYVDGAIERAGSTPHNLRLSAGEHRLRLVLDGYSTEERTIEVTRARHTFSFRLTEMGRLDVRAANESARGGTVRIDGEELGTVPTTARLEPGRHQLAVEREGYEPFSQWIELTAGQTFAITVTLTARAPEQGTILVSGDVSGAEVLVDNRSRGTTPAIIEVEAGEHTVEVRAEGYEPHRETVTVAPGARVTLSPSLAEATGSGGSLRVLSNPTGAVIFVDGDQQGSAPITVEDLEPGTHIVEARVDGRSIASERVTIEAGRRETVMLEISRGLEPGSLRVSSSVSGAEVLVDGRSVGNAPISVPDVEPGNHTVTVRAAGHDDWEQNVNVNAGQQTVLHATPSSASRSGRISVVSSTPGAVVLIDGAVAGGAPLREHELAEGQHVVEVRADGYRSFNTTVNITEGLVRQISADLVSTSDPERQPSDNSSRDDDDDDDEDNRRRRDRDDDDDDDDDEDDEDYEEWREERRRFVYSGIPLQPYKLAIDGGWGWPYLVGDYRVTMGVHRYFEISVSGISSYWYSEIAGHVRTGIRLLRILGLSGEIYMGGAFGEDDRSAFVFGITLFQGLEFRRLAITLRERLHVFSDNVPLSGGGTKDDDQNVLFFLGASVEYSISERWHLTIVVDYAPGQEQRDVLCGDPISSSGCGHWMPSGVAIEGRIGLGVRFF